MFHILLLAIGVFALAWTVSFLFTRKFHHLAPGPIPFPILGNAHQLERNLCKTLSNFAHKYGDVCLFYIGSHPIVSLSSPEAIHEVLEVNHNLCNGREHMPFAKEFEYEKGSVLNNTEQWYYTRKLTSHGTLRFLNNFVAQSLEKELKLLVDNTTKLFFENDHKEGDLPFSMCLVEAFFRYTWKIEIGGICSEEQVTARVAKVREALETFSIALSPANTALSKFAFFRHLYPYTSQGKQVRKVLKDTVDLFNEAYDEHVQEGRSHEIQKDFLDYAISVQDSLGLDKANVVHSTIEAFLGGNESSVTSATWIMMFLACYPEVQERLQKEIDEAVGIIEPPKHFHVEKLSYLDCVIREVMRMRPPVPIGLPRKAMEDIPLKSGKVIPKGATLFTNNWYLGFDAENWENPEVFNPDRFMREESTVKLKATEVREVKSYKLIPFGAGKRACTGYPMGKFNVKLTVATLVWKFEWSMRKKDLTPNQRGLVLEPVHASSLFPSAIRRQ
jgi:cytochrome P450